MKTCHLLLALGLAVGAGGALSQTTWKANCISSGSGAPETVGDGHVFWVSASTCVLVGGPLDGAVVTQNAIWENIKGAGTLLSGDGVVRKVGATAAYRNEGGAMKTLMQDGKPIGWEASGTTVYTLGAGSAASLKGKKSSWTAKATGPKTYVVENKLD